MDLTEIKKTFKKFGLKITVPRLKIVEAFFSVDRGITYAEVLEFTAKAVDRVTVYRTLKLFEDMGFIHRIIGLSDVPTYAVSNSEEKFDNSTKQHLHFCCIKCQGVFCLNDFFIPSVTLPDQFIVHSLNLTVVGVCQNCNILKDKRNI